MAWFRGSRRRVAQRPVDPAETEHLVAFARTRYGVEAYLEPRTTVTETTVILIAHDGEWTRRRVAGPAAAGKLATTLGIPLYEVAKVGYPRRMRDYNARRRLAGDL